MPVVSAETAGPKLNGSSSYRTLRESREIKEREKQERKRNRNSGGEHVPKVDSISALRSVRDQKVLE